MTMHPRVNLIPPHPVRPTMPRLFIGVPAPHSLETSGVRRALDQHARDPKIVDPENYHITLAFLGDTPQEEIPRIQDALDEATKNTPQGTGRAQGLGAFPDPKHASVIWIGVHHDPLTQLANDLHQALDERKLPYDDRHAFHAHLTIARLRRKQDMTPLLDPHQETDFGAYPIQTVNLYESNLTPEGPTYTTRASATLEEPS